MPLIRFKGWARKSPVDKSIKYYPIKVNYSNITTDILCKRIQANTSVPPGVVRAAALAIQDSVANFVMNGHSVKLGNFMSLRLTTVGKPAPCAADMKAENVQHVYVRCSWGSDILPFQNPAKYEFIKAGAIVNDPAPNPAG